MNFLRIDQAKERREPLAAVAPIVNSLLKLDDASRERLRRKFDLCFVMAKEGIPFTKYPVLYQLESRHEVDMGLAYNNDVAAQSASLITLQRANGKLLLIFKGQRTLLQFSDGWNHRR